MKLEDYKVLLLNQDLEQLDREIENLKIINEVFRSFEGGFIPQNSTPGQRTDNVINLGSLGEFSYSVYEVKDEAERRRSYSKYTYRREQWSTYSNSSLQAVIRHSLLPLLKSFDDDVVHWGYFSATKEKLVERINKKWDKYFEELEKTLDKICGSPLQEVFLNNYSDKFNQSRATVFGGPKGKAITWTTISGGYNIQQQHLRFFCKPLTNSHIKEFSISF